VAPQLRCERRGLNENGGSDDFCFVPSFGARNYSWHYCNVTCTVAALSPVNIDSKNYPRRRCINTMSNKNVPLCFRLYFVVDLYTFCTI